MPVKLLVTPVFAIEVHEALVLSVEYSQYTGLLLLPVSVSVPLPPLQMEAEDTLPPTATPASNATSVVVDAEHPCTSVTVTPYVPTLARAKLLIDGFWLDETKLFGPVQL